MFTLTMLAADGDVICKTVTMDVMYTPFIHIAALKYNGNGEK